MNTHRYILSAVCLSACLFTLQAAENTGSSSAEKSQNRSNQQSELLKGSQLFNANLQDAQGNKIGDIKDFAVNRDSGRIQFAIIDVGGFLGVGSRQIAVPWKAVQEKSDGTLFLNADKNRLQNAPEFKGNWNQLSDASWVHQQNQYYGIGSRRSESSTGSSERNREELKEKSRNEKEDTSTKP